MTGLAKRVALTSTELMYWRWNNHCDSCCNSSLRKTHGIGSFRKTTNEKKKTLLNSLASEYRSDKDSVIRREPGTGEWFIKDSKFLEWRDSRSSGLLWVSARPGCGKSVLARALIDESLVCRDSATSTLVYYFFQGGHEQRTHGHNALSAILHQLFENTDLFTNAFPSYDIYGETLRDTFTELWNILIKSAEDPSAGEIVCVLDALDECENDARNQLIQSITSFLSQKETHQKPMCALKFLITSRSLQDIEQRFHPLQEFDTFFHINGDEKSQRIGQEINLIIDSKVPSIMGDFSENDRKRISKGLKATADRTYLWLSLIMDVIAGSWGKLRKVSSIDSLISDLPSKLFDVYEKILKRSPDEAQTRILLQLIMTARRPLSLEEINIALALATQKGNTNSNKLLRLRPLHSLKSAIQNLCGSFVSILDGKVYLIHQTARDFLSKSTQKPGSRPHKWQGFMNIAMAHSTISQVCLDYLTLDDLASIPQDRLGQDGRSGKRDRRFRFCDYAALNWVVHYTSQDSERAKTTRKAARRLSSRVTVTPSYWCSMCCESRYLACSGWTELEIASLLGLIYVVEDLLNEEASCGAYADYSSALQAASSQGHHEVVQLLLDRGADVNAPGRHNCTALHAASYRGLKQVERLLLSRGADTRTRD